jgi:superkiller protein 3
MNLDNSQKNMLDQELREVIEKRRQGCSAEAIEKCLAALKVNSNYIPILMQLAAIYEKNQEYDKAIIEYNKIINLRPNDSITSAKIAKLMIRIKQYDKAIIYLEKAVEMTAKLPSWVYHELGDALKESGQLDESVIAYRKALMNKPVNPALIYKKIGNILCTQKKEEEAILIYQKALESEQNNIEVCLALAKLLVKHGKTDEAISLYKDIIKDHGNSAKLYHALGQAYISKGDWDNALTYLLSAQQAQLPGSQQVYYDIGYILEKLGRQKEAKKCY